MNRWKQAAMWGVLLGAGSLSMIGDLLSIDAMKGIGLATAMSPAPKVFSTVQGLETYSTRFYLEYDTVGGETVSFELTPELNANLRGPYNRRNVYGAVLAYGPVLPDRLRDPVTRYALCGDPPLLLQELLPSMEFKPMLSPIRVRLEPLPGTDLGALPTVWKANCE